MKTYSVAQKRKAKKAMPQLAETPKKYKSGNRKEPESQDPRKVVLESRCRQFGLPTTKANLLRVTGPHMGCQIGLVMEDMIGSTTRAGKDEVNALWSILCRLAASYASYRRRYIGQAEEPACQSIMTSKEFNAWEIAMETTSSPDLRTPEERDDAAVKNWMQWQGHLSRLDTEQYNAVQQARRDDFGLWAYRAPTETGKAALAGLKKLREIVD